MKNKDITNTDLLESMKKGFSKMEEDRVELLESLSRSFSNIEKKMATKEDITNLDLRLTTEIQDLRMDFKSFKKDTQNNFDEVNEKLDDSSDTATNYDKRIEILENKVLV